MSTGIATKSKMMLAVALVLGSTSLALAQDHARRAIVHHRHTTVQPFVSRDVALPQGAVPSAEEEWMDRASASYSGGGY